MSKTKLIVAVFAAVIAISAVASATASAGWRVGGVLLAAGSKQKLMTSGIVEQPALLQGGGAEISCGRVGQEDITGVAPEIEGTNKGSATSVTFHECVGSGVCPIAGNTITTVPVLITELTLDGTLAVKGAFVPETKTTFTTIKFEGAECALLGTQPVTGKASFLAFTGQDERTFQSVLLFSEAGKLKIGSSEAKLHGRGLLSTANLVPWSFI